MKEMMRAAMKALGIPLLTSDESASPTVTAIRPADFDGEELRKQVKKDFGLDLAGGQQHLKGRSEEHTSELQSRGHLVCRLLLEKKKKIERNKITTHDR